jgi:hypothetical protein
MCNGIDKNFKYCSRPVGSLENIRPDTIFQFDEIEQYEQWHNSCLSDIFNIKEAEISCYSEHLMILTAIQIHDPKPSRVPIAFVCGFE